MAGKISRICTVGAKIIAKMGLKFEEIKISSNFSLKLS